MKYKDLWSAPTDGIELSCEREFDNLRDTSALAVIEQSLSTYRTCTKFYG